jgi:hypothetical protein
MNADQAEAIVVKLKDMGKDASVYLNYDGRGGRNTPVAIVCEPGAALTIGYLACEVGVPIEDLPSRSDSLGTDIIYY